MNHTDAERAVRAFYNDNEKFVCQWLRNLIAAGELPAGDVDERSITHLKPEDISHYEQAHFFAGIGGWPLALRLAGWQGPVWTASCPCQPFSCAGKRKGKSDERHLWPAMFRLIRECRPPVIFGEQVGGPDGREWLAGSQSLQGLLDQEVIIGVLQGKGMFQGLPADLQSLLLRERTRAKKCNRSRDSAREISGVEENEESESFDDGGEIQGQTKRASLLIGGESYSRCHRCGRVRADEDSIQFGRGQDLGQSIFGQDRFIEGLHSRKCSCGAVLHQRDGEHLGREQNHRNSGCHHDGSAISVGRIAEAFRIRFESANRHPELAGVRADLEGIGYAVGAADLCAAGIGAPHRRQRLYWVAIAQGKPVARATERGGDSGEIQTAGTDQGASVGRSCGVGGLANTQSGGLRIDGGASWKPGHANERIAPERMADDIGPGLEKRKEQPARQECTAIERSCVAGRLEHTNSTSEHGRSSGREQPLRDKRYTGRFWDAFDIIECRDALRRVEPGSFPLAHGVPARMGRLRAYGNAIVIPLAVRFVQAVMECLPPTSP